MKPLSPFLPPGQTEKGRIATWLDKLGESDVKVCHRSSRDQHIGLADGLSRMPTKLTEPSATQLTERLAMPVLAQASQTPTKNHTSLDFRNMLPDQNLKKYRRSPMYYHLIEYLLGGEDRTTSKQQGTTA